MISAPIITDPLFWLIAVPAITSLGLAKGGFAGLGGISTPLVALYLAPLEAAALILPILIFQDVLSVWAFRKDWSAWNLKVLLPGAAIGIFCAWIFAGYVSDDGIRITVGSIGIGFVLNAWFNRSVTEPRPARAGAGVWWGSVSGFVSTLTQSGSPPFHIFTLPQRMPKMTLVGTTAIFFACVNAMKVIPYFALGQFSARNLATSMALLPLAFATNVLGIWLVKRTSMQAFYIFTYTLTLIISVALIVQGIWNIAHAS
ncbi:MAG TPA: sulfite exporter TauE/SafE family protein [Xanthobacteraceae bacterium]|nr:sulfite exporter TauE/SafE family protein [Xanthobacteraceae bacterium]